MFIEEGYLETLWWKWASI